MKAYFNQENYLMF